MIPGKYSGLVTCFAAAGMGMFVAIWLLDYSVVRSNWCLGAETQCFRDWVGALSGWMAAAGALAAVLITLPYLKRQVEEANKQAIEAKRQADFALGDSPPTFDVYSEGFVEIYFRVVNWNRRTLLIDEIRSEGVSAVGIRSIQFTNKQEESLWEYGLEEDAEPKFESAIRVSGFEDRSKAPVNCTIKARVFGGRGVGKVKAKFTVVGRLLGEYHGNIELIANASIHTFGSINGEADF